MPCYATIRILRGLKTLDEIESALIEAQWKYVRTTSEITCTNPYTNTELKFRAEFGGVTSPDGSATDADTATLRTYKTAKEVKTALRKKGMKLKRQTRTKTGIKIVMGG